ncbi:MAG: DUF4416 family protein [Syntrophales bacterium]|nr:DUF4416 family protein [Syntrophales bacterium]
MSQLRPPEPVKLVMSLLSPERIIIAAIIRELVKAYGEPDIISKFFAFPFTDYYEREMGSQLERRMVSFNNLVSPEALPEIKLFTTEVESKWAREGKRVINIDPGYVALAHLILATGKGYTHRPYLRSGVYADLTLIYQDGDFRTLPWTYPDYGSTEMLTFLRKVRAKYLKQLRILKG